MSSKNKRAEHAGRSEGDQLFVDKNRVAYMVYPDDWEDNPTWG